MKIAVRGGHTYSCRGAIGLIDETVEDRKVKDSLIKYLRQEGHEVYDVTPPDSCNTINSELSYGVNKAKEVGAELFIPIHFNNAYNSYDGAIGTEAYIYSKDGVSDVLATRIVNKLAANGFIKHGNPLKVVGGDLHDTREAHNRGIKTILIEVCFVEATEDVATYKKLGSDNVGRLIAEAIVNKSISPSSSSQKKYRNLVLYANDVDKRAAEYLADYFTSLNEDGKAMHVNSYTKGMGTSVWAVGGGLDKVDANVRFSGKNRFETLKAVCKKIGI